MEAHTAKGAGKPSLNLLGDPQYSSEILGLALLIDGEGACMAQGGAPWSSQRRVPWTEKMEIKLDWTAWKSSLLGPKGI